jgi:carboxymethylenebutenolidase
MIEKQLQVQTADGVMSTFVAHPAGHDALPAVVIYMDAPGIREELYSFARRIAAQGYCCLLPDLYYRRGLVRMNLDNMTEEMGREMFSHMRSLTNALVLADTAALLEALESEPLAAAGPKGCIGYCMSGQFIMSVAGTFPVDFRASVSCYGVGIVTR